MKVQVVNVIPPNVPSARGKVSYAKFYANFQKPNNKSFKIK